MKTRFSRLVSALLVVVMLMAFGSASAATNDPQRLDIYYTLALNAIEKADYDKAMTYLDSCCVYCDETTNPVLYADIHLKKGCVYTLLGEDQKALDELAEATRVQPKLSDAYLVKTQIYSEVGEYEAAIANLDTFIELAEAGEEYELVRAQLEALQQIDVAAAEQGTTEAEKAYLAGVSKMQSGLYAYAVNDFRTAMDDETYGSAAAYNAGVCLINESDDAGALEAFLKCKEKEGAYDGLYYNLGVCEMAAGTFAAAIEDFTASIEKESYLGDATYNRAVCYMSIGESEKAVTDFTAYLAELDKAVEAANTANAETEGYVPQVAVDAANYYRAICSMSLGDYEGAIADLNACVENKVSPEDSCFSRALCYLQQGKNDEAKADFDSLIEKGAREFEARYYRALILRAQGDNENALADLTACIENGYDLYNSYYQRAQIYFELGMEDAYVADLEAAAAQ